MSGFNVGRGLFRAWLFIAVLWAVCAVWIGWAVWEPDIVSGNYQAVIWLYPSVKIHDWEKQPFYEAVHSPSKEKLSPSFATLGYYDLTKIKESGKLAAVSFPDGSSLYIHSGYSEDDRQYLAKEFWDQRWRRWSKLGGYMLLLIVGPMGVLFALGYSGLWVARGFRAS